MRFLLVLALLAVPRLAFSDEVPNRTERVIAAGKLWAQIKFFHPYLAYKNIDWDAAFVAAIPKLEAATTKDAYKRALAELLAKIGDPVTRVLADAPAVSGVPSGEWLTTPAPNVVVVDLAGFVAGGFDYVGFTNKGQRVVTEAAKTKVLVIDSRASDPEIAAQVIDYFLDALPAIDQWPLERAIEHRGWRTQEGVTSGGYSSSFTTAGAKPPKPGSPAAFAHVVFIVDARSMIPSAILGLQMSGRASLIAPATITDESVVTMVKLDVAGTVVQVRISELLTGAPATDVRAPVADLRTRAIALAKTKIGNRGTAQARPVANLPPLQPRDDNDYADQQLPSRELRMLGALRIWAILDRFNPYRYLTVEWDQALRDLWPKIEGAADRDKYIDALKELGVRAGDGHIWVYPANGSTTGRGVVAVGTRIVEGKLAVTRIFDAAEAKGLAIGDVIEMIDGKAAAATLAEKRVTISGSNDDARDQTTAMMVLWGPDGGKVKLGVRGADGKQRTVELVRRASFMSAMWAAPTTPSWKKLPANIGYVDMKALTVPEVDAMFKDLGGTKAIVFDMRGYPKGTAWSIAPRINVKKATHGAQFLQPLVVGGTDAASVDQRIRFIQPIPPLPPGASIYRGMVVVLIDDRAISQSEHTCLFFQETAGATFVGSPTAGANGDVTMVRLPGGVRMSFTGQEVRHLDGKQLQKLGIQPHVRVRPTLAGLRGGKDELLDRALAVIATGK